MLTNNYNHQTAVFRRIARQLRTLVKKDGIRFPDIGDGDYSIAAIFAIQLLKYYSEPEIKTSAPEGYRALINDKNKEIILSVDFYYHGKRLHLSHCFDGDILQHQIEALNAAEVAYSKKKTDFQVCYVEFLYAEQPYLTVYNQHRLSLYTYQDKLLKKISKAQLADKLSKIQSSIQPFPQ